MSARATWWCEGRSAIERDGVGIAWRVGIPAAELPGVVCYLDETTLAEGQEGDSAIFWTAAPLRAMREAKSAGLRVILETDDNWLAMDGRTLALQDAHIGDRHEIAALTRVDQRQLDGHREAVELADAVIVSTEALGRAYRALGATVFVCPAAFVAADWPEPEKPQDGVFRVGFAGSPSHAADIHLIREALVWASGQPGVEAVFVGWNPADTSPDEEVAVVADAVEARRAASVAARLLPTPAMVSQAAAADARYAEVKQMVVDRMSAWSFPLRVLPWSSTLAEHRGHLARLDLGLCPVVSTPFADCRSDCKVLEFGLSGALPIVSQVEPYRKWFDTLPVARDASDFLELVRWAVENRELVSARAAELRQHVLATRSIEQGIAAWEAAIDPRVSEAA